MRQALVEWFGVLSSVARADGIVKDVGKLAIAAFFGWWLAQMADSGRQDVKIENCLREASELERRIGNIELHGAPTVQRELNAIRQQLLRNEQLIINHMINKGKSVQGP